MKTTAMYCVYCGLFVAFLASTALGGVLGCEKKQAPQKSDVPKAEEQPVIDPNLGKAIAATSAATDKPGSSAKDPNAPPANGIFTPEQADALHPRQASMHIELGTEGQQPKLSLRPSHQQAPKTMSFFVATMIGPRSGLPSLDMSFGLSSTAAQAASSSTDDSAALSDLAIRATLNKVNLSQEQPGKIPDNVAKEVVKMKGSYLQFTLISKGGAQVQSISRSNAVSAEIEHTLVAVAEAVAVGAFPVPDVPLGQGATWIARSRDTFGGLDVLSYRMIRITSIDEKEVNYTITTRQYHVGNQVTKAALPENSTLAQFESSGEGQFTIEKGQRFAKQGELSYTLMLGLKAAQNDGKPMMPLMMHSKVKFPLDK